MCLTVALEAKAEALATLDVSMVLVSDGFPQDIDADTSTCALG